jgi:NTP pyrophosphatase (non-canonical NTP hydrolase)
VADGEDADVTLAGFQETIAATYLERDRARGVPATVAWLAEELGELAQAVRKGTPEQQLHELGDVLAWLASLANQLDLSLDGAVGRYTAGCPRCGASPCICRPISATLSP